MEMTPPTERAAAHLLRFREHLRTVVLGTVSADGEPDASVAAAITHEHGTLVVYVSGLAAHTRNLQATRRASVLLVEDESAAAQPLARVRLTFACTAAPITRDTAEAAALVATFQARFGAAIDQLSSLPDFQFFRLTPTRGRLVAGFGQAFTVDPRTWSITGGVGP